MMEKLKERFFNLESAYKILVFLIIIFLFFIIIMFVFIFLDYKPNQKFENITKLIPAVGIILSALLASVSVLKGIKNTNRIEKEKEEKEEKQFLNKLRIYIADLEFFIKFFKGTCSKSDIYIRDKLLLNQKILNHSKNSIFKDISFIEEIKSDEFKLINYINSIELLIHIILEDEAKEYQEEYISSK